MFRSVKQSLNDASSAEYAISVMKHIYKDCVIVQYGIRNTLEDQVLSKLTVKVNGIESDGLRVAGVVGLPDGEVIKNGD